MKRKVNCIAMALLLATFTAGCTGEIKADTTNQVFTIGSSVSNGVLLGNSSSSYVLSEIQMLSQDDFFSNRDYRTEIESENPVSLDFYNGKVTINNNNGGVSTSNNIVTITKDGTYILSGSLTDGQIIIDTENDTDKVQLFLNGVDLNCSTSAPINVVSADKVFITMADGSENFISANISLDNSVDGGIFSKCDLTLNGNGTLNIDAKNGDGIVAKDELTITSGTYNIISDGHGMDSNDGIAIANGTFNINANKDGLHAEHSSNPDKGYIYIVDGNFSVNAGQDGIDTSSFLEINNGNFHIITNDGWENAPIKEAIPNTRGMKTSTGMSQDSSRNIIPNTQEPNIDMENMIAMKEQMKTSIPQIPQDDINNMHNIDEIMSKLEQLIPQSQQQIQQMPPIQQIPQTSTNETNMNLDREIRQNSQPMLEPIIENMATVDDESNSSSMKGIKSVGEIRIYNGNFNLDCYDDAIHSDTTIDIYSGTYKIGTGDDGIHTNWDLNIYGGDITIVNSFEGLEGQRINISGGNIDMYSIDDGINAASTNKDPNNSEVSLTISGGNIVIDSNGEGDGLDSNGSILMTGGTVLVSSTMDDNRDVALDAELGAVITGGTFIGTGSSSANIQNFESNSSQGSILVSMNQNESGNVQLIDSIGNILVDVTPAKEYSAVIISIPELSINETYSLIAGEYSETITLDSLQYGTGMSMMKNNRMR